MLPGDAIENEEVSIPAGVKQKFARFSLEFAVDDHRGLRRVPVVRVMRRRLEIPGELTRIHIESHDGGGIEVVAFARRAGKGRSWVGRSEVVEMQLRIVASRKPRAPASVPHGVKVR